MFLQVTAILILISLALLQYQILMARRANSDTQDTVQRNSLRNALSFTTLAVTTWLLNHQYHKRFDECSETSLHSHAHRAQTLSRLEERTRQQASVLS